MIIDDLQQELNNLQRRAWIFQDQNVSLDVHSKVLTLTEQDKTLATAEQLWNYLCEQHATRDDIIVNIGGGVLCDIGGFVASTYLRGLDYINVPTTLLAMVDAADGGKTGVNFKNRKNAIGVIKEPYTVWHYLPFLKTLPKEQLLSGFAEIIKHALLFSEKELDVVEKAMGHLDDPQRLYYEWPRVITQSVQIKKMYVAQDLDDKGVRRALNFGHTIGQAYEEWCLEKKQPIPHGYAVMYGLVQEVALSVKYKHCPSEVYDRVRGLWEKYYCTGSPLANPYDLTPWLQCDKKNGSDGRINFTLLTNVGQPVVNCLIPLAGLLTSEG